jgi:hypothetical protein
MLLGIKLDASLNFKLHFSDVIQSCNYRLNLIRTLSSYNKKISIDKLLVVYKAYILSIIQYSFLPYIYASNLIKQTLQSIQNSALSTIFKLPIYTNIKNVHKIIKLSTIEEKLDSMLKTYVVNKEKSDSFQSIIAQMKQTSSESIFIFLYYLFIYLLL